MKYTRSTEQFCGVEPKSTIGQRHRMAMLLGSVAFSLLGGAPLALAQETSSGPSQVGEVIVTAQKRSERLQDVPITISAFNAASLKEAGVTSVTDLGVLVPGLIYSDVVGYGLPYLRGVGTVATGPGFENPIATYVDGVYYASQAGAVLDLDDIAAVEVDKGPQGTLFGRNATGGAIQIKTLAPSSVFGGVAEVGYGNYGTVNGQLYLTGGLAPDLAGNFIVSYRDQQDGYGRNLANGEYVDRSSGLMIRSKLLYTPNAKTSVTLAVDYGYDRGAPSLNPAPGTIPQFVPPVATNPRDVYGSPQPFSTLQQAGVALTVDYDLGFAKLTSISAFRHTVFNALFDSTLTAVPGTTFFVGGPEPHDQFTQELQLASNGGGKLNWITGAYYFFENSGYGEPTTIGGSSFALFGIPSGILQRADDKDISIAAYGQGTYSFTSKTRVTLGLRVTDEFRDKTFYQLLPDYPPYEIIPGRKNFENLSWRVAIQHDFDRNLMIYASESRGFKAGTFSNGLPVKPETLDAFETGLKSSFLDRRIHVNLSGFFYLYSNMQTVTYPNGSEVVSNGGSSQLYGLDLDTQFAVTPEFKLGAGLEALHSEFTSFPDATISVPVGVNCGFYPCGGTYYINRPGGAKGDQLPYAAPFTATITADYTKQLSFAKMAANVTYSYDSGWYPEADNRLHQPSYDIVNSSISFGSSDDGLVLKLWGKNLTNSLYAAQLTSQTNGDFIEYAPPRTYGVTLTRKF